MDHAVQNSLNATREFALSEREFRMISDLANARYGLFLQPSKKALVHSRLAKRLRTLNLSGFDDYCDLLNRPEGDAEQTHLLSALTTNVTHFFREVHHFEYLKEVIAPKLIAKAKAGNPVRVWSAACSTGQEAYSIAASLIAADPDINNENIRILATDIDPKVIETARKGRYPSDQIEAVPYEWRQSLLNGRPFENGTVYFDGPLRALISFGELNLVADWPMRRNFDVIFCRNAAIYFDKATQARLWCRFSNVLVDEGYLMIGHSERLSGPAMSAFSSVGVTSYQKRQNHKNDTEGEDI